MLRVRYRYDVRQAKTATLVGTFDLDSNGRQTPKDLYCPESVSSTNTADAAGMADVVADNDLAAALRPYVESSHP